MSCRKYSHKEYNRAKAKEEHFYWLDLVFQDDGHYDEWYCCEECSNPWFNYYDGMYGEISSMDQYHQMKVLTLLRLLNVKTASDTAKYYGW